MTGGAAAIHALRVRSQAGISDCKRALEATGGDLDRACDWLRAHNLSKPIPVRPAAEGAVVSYLDPGRRIGVLVEVNCQTDFVARTSAFQTLCHHIAAHLGTCKPTPA